MENQNKNANPLESNKIYQILTWKDRKTTLKWLALIHLFFYFYWIRDNSFINLCSRGVMLMIFYKLAKPGFTDNSKDFEVASEETMKQLYIITYVALNKGISYLRNLV